MCVCVWGGGGGGDGGELKVHHNYITHDTRGLLVCFLPYGGSCDRFGSRYTGQDRG